MATAISDNARLWKRYNAYLRQPPAITLSWHDAPTGARAWLVINSLRGGAAGGGTRMRLGVTQREVTYLAKTMELKFAVCGPPIGGGKSGIDFDPSDPRKPEVLERFYRAIRPYLRNYYGTGGDIAIDEVTEVIPTLAKLGIAHPQEGVVRGHFNPGPAAFQRTLRTLDAGVRADAGEFGVAGVPLNVSDMITGYGVARSVVHFYERQGRSVAGARVLIEGFGNVGAACALYLARAGARIVAIADADKVLFDDAGLDAADVESLVRQRRNRLLPHDPRAVGGARRAAFWDTSADVFVAAALSSSLHMPQLERLSAAGVHIVASGANQPFAEAKVGSTIVQQRADRRFTVIPDFIANCGMARAFSYLMEPGATPAAPAVFAAVDTTVCAALDEAIDRVAGATTGLFRASMAMMLDRVGV